MWNLLFAFFCFFWSFSAFSDLPHNNLDTEDNIFWSSNIDESSFYQAISDLQKIYEPIAKNLGYNLKIEGDWEDSTVNAYTYRSGKTWYVQMFGGLARRQEITLDGFKLVICHELGHQMGGYPFSGWASAEGQADYIAEMICARKAFALQTENHIDSWEYCESVETEPEKTICNRSLSAGKSLALLLSYLRGHPEPTYETPDPTIVSKTQKTHPNPQCRLDTYLAGSLCFKSWDDNFIPKKDGYVCDNRPKCWFKS